MPNPSPVSIQEAKQAVESAEAQARLARQQAKAAKEKAKQAKAEFKKARKAAKHAKKAAKQAESEAALAQRVYDRLSRRVKAVKTAKSEPENKGGRAAGRKRHSPTLLVVAQQPGPESATAATAQPAAASSPQSNS